MLSIEEDGTIYLTRGDTAYLSVGIEYDTPEGTEYELEETDIVEFSIKRSTKREDPYLVHKQNTGSSLFKIVPEDTSELKYGTYKYDVQLTKANGDVFTVVEPTDFNVTSEVT